ncbi:MAK10-like protein [Tanacetum coccineum]|uniref:MAK10-like protein n=1 Tax=Tanacetum coccineum TaxID=301880 RepID=A0ABQ5AQY5_9ASTR
MTEMFGLLKELTTSKAPEKVLIREDVKSPVTKNVNSISLARREEERNDKDGIAADGGINETDTEIPVKEAEKENKAEGGTKNEPIRRTENDEVVEVPSSQPIETQQPKELEPTLKEEFHDLHLNLPVLEVLTHAPIYNALLDNYEESLELGKNGSTSVQGEVSAKMEDPGLFTLPCVEVHIGKLKLLNDFYVIDMKKDLETPLLVGRGFLATANAVIDCRMAKIAVGEGITRTVFGVKGVALGEEEAPYWTTLGKKESYKPRPQQWNWSRRHKIPYRTTARKDFLRLPFCPKRENWLEDGQRSIIL